jgi:teichuronic acid biosynthesis glycosyltransferase TuaH
MMNDDAIQKRDFLILGLQQWEVEEGCSNAKYIASTLARMGNRVLFVNTPLDRFSRLRPKSLSCHKKVEVLKGCAKGLDEVEPNLWVYYPKIVVESINWISNSDIFNLVNKFNNKRFANQIKKALNQLGFDNVVLINDNDLFKCFYLKEYLSPSLCLFYLRDFLTGVDYWQKHGGRLEPQLLQKSDLVVANSPFYAEYARRYNPNAFFVGQGCDFSLFNGDLFKGIPLALRSIKKPVVGYVGALNTLRLDIEIITHIAQARPDWNVVLVGPEDQVFKQSVLHQLANVHFMGNKPLEMVPAYIKYFDVCVNPQVVNDVTVGNYPLKIDEYLALGKPVVATQTQTMEYFRPHVYLASSKEEYVTLIEQALQEDCLELSQMRKDFVAAHSWDNNVKKILDAIQKVEDTKKQLETKTAEYS